MKKILSAIKPYLRWVILGGTLFFLLKALKDNWREVADTNISADGWLILLAALLVTLLAHIWSGLVWTGILWTFRQRMPLRWAMEVYLKTNVAKYMPGNVWHFAGRIAAVTRAGGSLGVASLSVLLEPLLMAASALAIAMISSSFGIISTTSSNLVLTLQILVLAAVLLGVHPRILNPILRFLNRAKNKLEQPAEVGLERYPLLPLLGEAGFLVFRGSGFLLTLTVLVPITLAQIPQLISAFSFAWLLGLVIPGAPGGLGVFEATVIALLDGSFQAGDLLTTVAFYRLISVLAEVGGAGLAVVSERFYPRENP